MSPLLHLQTMRATHALHMSSGRVLIIFRLQHCESFFPYEVLREVLGADNHCNSRGESLVRSSFFEVERNSVGRLTSLLAFLELDPDNPNLLTNAAEEAMAGNDFDLARDLLERAENAAVGDPKLQNLSGLLALREGRWPDAAECFQDLLDRHEGDSNVQFNLAWVKALQDDHQGSLDLLNDETVLAAPAAAGLKVQMMHHLGRIEDAVGEGERLLALVPGNDDLLGALSVAAMDNDDIERATRYAQQSTTSSDALSTQGLLLLDQDQALLAISLFDKVLAKKPDAPRALLGKGLADLSLGRPGKAAISLERGAEIFGDHLGSWIGAGWAWFAAGDVLRSRHAFETALALDDNFAESHGGLAVLDLATGDVQSARRRSDIALKLDKECLGGMLARTLLLEADGRPDLAVKIRERALNMAVGPSGITIAQAMAGIGRADPRAGKPN
jgi:tetratricopeptide (TPR) repeat protein